MIYVHTTQTVHKMFLFTTRRYRAPPDCVLLCGTSMGFTNIASSSTNWAGAMVKNDKQAETEGRKREWTTNGRCHTIHGRPTSTIPHATSCAHARPIYGGRFPEHLHVTRHRTNPRHPCTLGNGISGLTGETNYKHQRGDPPRSHALLFSPPPPHLPYKR